MRRSITYVQKSGSIFSVSKTILVAVIALLVSACNKPEAQIASETGKHQRELKYVSSVTLTNGVYKVDTNIILAGRNKKTLVANLLLEKLIDKKQVEEIPDFIKVFLSNVSKDKEFSMANPGEKYQEGWFDQGKGTPTKQLIYFGMGKSVVLFSYYSGGIRRRQNLIILKYEGNKIIDYWYNNYDLDAKTKSEMIEYLKDNRIRKDNC